MADNQWLLKEDGYLNVNTEATNIVYHSNLYVVLVFTRNNEVKVLDINSGVVLHSCRLAADDKQINCRYLPKQNRVLFWDSQNIGMRGDYNGVLLLDTILQTPVSQSDDIVKVEMLLTDAVLFLQSLQTLEEHGLENTAEADVTNELILKIDEAHALNKKGIKAQKWNTICLELPHSSLKIVASNVVFQLKRLEQHIPALTIASTINERLTDLVERGRLLEAINSGSSQRLLMYSEATRRQTFARWPHMDYKWALPNRMAQAGFYHQPRVSGDDRAMCFTCNVCLVCWEQTDEPWSEHDRHSPSCPFVKGECTQNVPLAITYATAAAVRINNGFTIMSSGTQTNVICTGRSTGEIQLWKIKRQIAQLTHIDIRDVADRIFPRSTNTNATAPPPAIELDSMCTYRLLNSSLKTNENFNGLKIVCGVSATNFHPHLMVYTICKSRYKSKPGGTSYESKEHATSTKKIAETEDGATAVATATGGKKSTLMNIEDTMFGDESLQQLSEMDTFLPSPDDQSTSDIIFKWRNVDGDEKTTATSTLIDKCNDVLQFDDDIDLTKMMSTSVDDYVSAGNETKLDYIAEESETVGTPPNCFFDASSMPTTPITSDVSQLFAIVPILAGSYVISEIIQACDPGYFLVILRKANPTNESVTSVPPAVDDVQQSTKMDVDGEEEVAADGVQLFVYKVRDDGTFIEQPICSRVLFEDHQPVQICMLPSFMDDAECMVDVTTEDTKHGLFAMACADGSLQLLALTSLRTICDANATEKFVSVTYCKNLRRLCACTMAGVLHFYSFYDMDKDSSDEQEAEKLNLLAVSDASLTGGEHDISETDGANKHGGGGGGAAAPGPLPSTSSSPISGTIVGDSMFAFKTELSLDDLKHLYLMTQFDEMLTPYTAEVPACWNEIIQAQKQRCGPQNLRPGNDSHLIKSYRLHNDATTWDEHIIEITLPKPAALGHINFKFSLYQQCPNPPAIQITLLKQNTSGFGYRMKTPVVTPTASSETLVDENIDFKIEWPDNKDNPVLCEEYLQAHNAEIIAGPIELSSCMDLTEQGGSVTLTSPKLFKAKGRNFLIHIKTMVDLVKDGPAKTRVPVRKKSLLRCLFPSFAAKTPSPHTIGTSSGNGIGAAANETGTHTQTTSKQRNSNDYYIGCDWLHEISISIRSTKPVYKIPNERQQRVAMLESNTLLIVLLNIASKAESTIEKNIALDILLWIISIRMTRFRSPKSDASTTAGGLSHRHSKANFSGGITAPANGIQDIVVDMYMQQIDCANIVNENLTELMRNCILSGNRSTANKCVKVILITLEGATNMPNDRVRRIFQSTLKSAILACLPELAVAKYAGALRWFTLLISGTSTVASQGQIAEKCVELLLKVTEEIENRWTPYTSLLRTRFGLYGLPFDPDLFDAELALSTKYNAMPNSLAAMVDNAATIQQQNNVIDFKKFCSTDGTEFRSFPSQIRRKGISNQLRGLLEVEPLHFTCCAASEATRVENMDSANASQANNVIEDVVFEASLHNNNNNADSSSVMLPAGTTIMVKDSKGNIIEEDDDLVNNIKNILVDKLFFSSVQKTKLKQIEAMKFKAKADAVYNAVGGNDDKSSGDDKQASGGGNLSSAELDVKSIANLLDMLKKSMDSPAENVIINMLSTKIQEFMTNNCFDDTNANIPWHKLLSLPPKQMISVERMHSGARRFVTLDFGSPIMLTDLVIPACEDIVSLCIDIWCFEEDADSVRLANTSDIGTKTLVLSDLQPPPICRYLKITTTGRFGMSAARCVIPIGSFFGHVLVLENDGYADPVLKYIKPKTSTIPVQLKALNSLYEDVHCRYSLASSKLAELLDPLFNSDISNVAHMQAYLNKNCELGATGTNSSGGNDCRPSNIGNNNNSSSSSSGTDNGSGNVDQSRILNVYEECITFQHQLNVIQNVIQRLEAANMTVDRPLSDKARSAGTTLVNISSDKLRVLSECLVEVLLHFIIEYGVKNVLALHSMFNLKTCTALFNTLVVSGDNNMQLATCSLLVRMCCFQQWWGEFLASTFTRLYSSQNTKIFPQDRVFFLLTYLGRKSITMGSCRSIVIDAILKTLATLLVPLSSNVSAMDDQEFHNDDVTGAKTDFQLITWLLLFLSVCLDDGIDKKEQSSMRWDFMSGEANVSKARAQTITNNSGRSFSRSFKKRFFQNKQSSSLTANDKIYISDKAVQVANLTSQIEFAFKQHESFMKKKKLPMHELFMEVNDKMKSKNANNSFGGSGSGGSGGGGGSSTSASSSGAGAGNNKQNAPPKMKESRAEKEQQAFDKGLKSLKSGNIIIVIRGMIGLLLAMDYTCNMDLFLLTCKIIARLVSVCRPSIQLSKIITTTQLQQLVRLAVWKDQQQPWAVHAITCLLQGILEADKNFKITRSFDEGSGNGMDGIIESTNDLAAASDAFMPELIPETMVSDNTAKDITYEDEIVVVKSSPLPSLMECEDAEMDDIIDDILERGKVLMREDSLTLNRTGLNSSYRSVSTAMDARLDYGLETNVEIKMRRHTMMSSLNLFASLPQIQTPETFVNPVDIPVWPDHVIQAWSGSEYNQGISTNIMFVLVFDNIFADLHLQDSWLNLEQALQLWLTLNSELSEKGLNSGFSPSDAPKIPFGPNAVQGLLSALSWHIGIKLRTWSLAFQCLTLACNPYFNYDNFLEQDDMNDANTRRMGVFLVNNTNFEKMLQRFYSSTDINTAGDNRCAGPTICKLIHELFVWMEIKSDVMDMPFVKKKLKEILLRVVLQLVQPGGAISMQQGPLDAQNLLIKELITFQYEKTDLGVAMSIIESVSYLVHNHISNGDKVFCQPTPDSSQATNVFSGIFDTVIGSENLRQNKTVSSNTLLVCLLKLSSKLVQTTLPRRGDESMTSADIISAQNLSNESQTDEIKAEQQHQPDVPVVKVPCVADTVLQHHPTMARLLGSLSQSSSSSFALLASSLYPLNSCETANTNLIMDPTTVADAVFQILLLLSKKATQPILVIKPLYDFLHSTSNIRHALPKLQLSEPFLWFVLKVLEVPVTVKIFTEMGGIKVLCQSLVRCNRTLINMQPGLVSLIMQYISKSPNQPKPSHSNVDKKLLASVKSTEGLINFAPFCCITTENSTAQPADALVQAPIASHRRARLPAWTYSFYPNESHIDLVLTLPTAVLLKEIQLQPHLPTLAASPSAVALEINRDNSIQPIPISQPMSTIGLTCIRLKLPQPEIANSIVLRLYRPKDTNSIGLNQISVLGTTVFSGMKSADGTAGTSQDSLLGDDDTAAKSSLGWLKILARCFSVATYNVENQALPKMVIQSAADFPGFLEACCSLLNVTPPAPSVALQNLETVLVKMGLHSKELGLKLIENLLKSTLPQTFRLSNEAVSDLLYDLCTTQDECTVVRIAAVIDWAKSLYAKYGTQMNLMRTNPYSGFVKCLSSILWTAYTTNLSNELPSLITEELFHSIYMWTELLEDNEPLKGAIDAMLCSICCIRPQLFPLLLKNMGVLVPNLSTGIDASISDDRKDTEGMTDDTKEAANNTGEWYCRLVIQDLTKLSLNAKQLKTISLACQSECAVHQLLDSGLPKLLSFAILEFCYRVRSNDTAAADSNASFNDTGCMTDSDKAENRSFKHTAEYPMVNVGMIAKILDFFSETCSEGHMRDWLGSYEGSVFWSPLLDLLCNDKPIEPTSDYLSIYSKLEAATIKFLSKVTACHPKNQENLTVILISVIRKPNQQPGSSKYIISGFTRRLILQLLLESERILVSVHSDLPLQKRDCISAPINNHPSKRPNAHQILFYLSTHVKCQEILDNVVYNNLVSPANVLAELTAKHAQIFEKTNALLESRKELVEFGYSLGSGIALLSVAAGVTAKDKRFKEAKNQMAAMKTKDLYPIFNKFKVSDTFTTNTMSNTLTHLLCPGVILSSDTTISQILAMLHNSGISLATPCITLSLIQSQNKMDDLTDDTQMKAADLEPLHSPLQVFSSRGGLSLLAHYLPTVYPENPKALLPYVDKEKSPPANEWVKVEQNDDIYEDLDDTLTDSSAKMPINLSVPQHSLAAFGLFLRLPAYSDVLLRDKVKAQCLLRLVLGVTGDGEGNEIYTLSLASSLPTLPFEVFRQLLDCSPLTTDDGVLLRRMVIEVGAMHLVLNCMGIFTHHSQVYQVNSNTPTGNESSTAKGTSTSAEDTILSDDKSHMYWAKGTGFGTGSTQQSWDVEQALMRQKSEEEHVTVLLQILSSYINPGDMVSSMFDSVSTASATCIADIDPELCDTSATSVTASAELPPIFFDLLQNSCLIPALSSYLQNDSVLDITRHIPLYRAILQLLRAIAQCSQLVTLLLPQNRPHSGSSIALLLSNLKTCVDTYASRLKVNKKSNIKGQTQKVTLTLDDGDDEGLALLIPDIQETAVLVQKATRNDEKTAMDEDDEQRRQMSVERPLSSSIEQRYLEVMKKLQFDTYEMMVECDTGYRFVITHHFENNVRMAGDRNFPLRMKRLAQETVTLSTSLPLSYSSSVFVRCDTDRLDIMKVLITGPAETPYANGCFEFDVYFPADYPNSPMMVNLETTGRHTVRFNPNLYNDGKVCLSVLNTWHGRPEEKWNPQTSSFLQVLVSIQSLILVAEPYFNEPGFERSLGSASGTHSSREYNSNIYQGCVRWAMLEQIKNPCPCFKQIIHTHFWLKRHEICTQIEEWIAELNKPQQSERSGRTVNSMVLRRQYHQLREELAKLPVPEGLEDLDRPFPASNVSPTVTFESCTNFSMPAQQESSAASGGHLEDTTSISSAVFDSNNSNSSVESNTPPNIQIDSNDPLLISFNEII